MFRAAKNAPLYTKASSQGGGVCQYHHRRGPEFASTGWSSVQVPVFMFMESGDGDMIAKVDVGPFTYVDGELAG